MTDQDRIKKLKAHIRLLEERLIRFGIMPCVDRSEINRIVKASESKPSKRALTVNKIVDGDHTTISDCKEQGSL